MRKFALVLAILTLTASALAQVDPGKRFAKGALHPMQNPTEQPQHTSCAVNQPGQ